MLFISVIFPRWTRQKWHSLKSQHLHCRLLPAIRQAVFVCARILTQARLLISFCFSLTKSKPRESLSESVSAEMFCTSFDPEFQHGIRIRQSKSGALNITALRYRQCASIRVGTYCLLKWRSMRRLRIEGLATVRPFGTRNPLTSLSRSAPDTIVALIRCYLFKTESCY